MTFTECAQRIDGLKDKQDKLYEAIASNLSDAIVSRNNEGKLTMKTTNDVRNLIRGFTAEEQNEILIRALVLVGIGSTGKTSKKNKADDVDYDELAPKPRRKGGYHDYNRF